MACAGEMVAPGRRDPTLAPESKRPWLSCAGESGFRCEIDLEVEHRGQEAVQVPCMFPLSENHYLQITLTSSELAGQRDKASIFLTIQDYLLWF